MQETNPAVLTATDMLRVPYLLSAEYIDRLLKAGPDAIASFIRRQVDLIYRAWHDYGDAALVAFAASSLSSAVESKIPPCLDLARIYIIEAEALLAAATHPGMVLRAFKRAGDAQDMLARLDPAAYSFELLSESILIAGVALKVIGEFDDSIDYLRGKAKEWRLDSIASVALTRQEVMMFQDENRHLLLLHEAADYQAARPREYYRTLKRTTELLLNRRRIRLADELAPELGRAFAIAKSELSVLARLSFMRDISQLFAVRGDRYRAQRLLKLCLRVAERSRYAGQVRQIRGLLAALRDDSTTPRMETFRVGVGSVGR